MTEVYCKTQPLSKCSGLIPNDNDGIVCKQLVEAMGGDMWVESSRRLGEGSRFCFTFPEIMSGG